MVITKSTNKVSFWPCIVLEGHKIPGAEWPHDLPLDPTSLPEAFSLFGLYIFHPEREAAPSSASALSGLIRMSWFPNKIKEVVTS